MQLPDTVKVNGQGHLTIAGCDTIELAAIYGTPLYVMDEDAIRGALRIYRNALEDNYPGGGTIAYASKACSFQEMYRIVMQEGCGADVVSGGELYTALQVGFPPEKLFFHGNNKTAAELRMALDAGVGRIVVDNFTELETLSRLAVEMGKRAEVLLRITPGISAHTHAFIRTGEIDSKFGFTLENGDAMKAAEAAVNAANITLKGLHCHIGSQIFDDQPFAHAAEVMVELMHRIHTSTGVILPELNLGGGFGIAYTPEDTPQGIGEMMRAVAVALKKQADRLRFPCPKVIFEPGRSIVANAGLTLYTVGNVKHIPGVRTYVSVDGGMPDNPRYALYQAAYTVALANKADREAGEPVTIAGRCCESGDLIQENVPLPPCEAGDILAVLGTGAYNYSMSSNYNRLPRPAIVMVKEGTSRVVVKAETYEDLIRNDV